MSFKEIYNENKKFIITIKGDQMGKKTFKILIKEPFVILMLKYNHYGKSAFFLLIILFLIGCNLKEENLMSSENELSQEVILDWMKDYNVPGMSIAVVSKGEIVWAKGYGIANTITGEKVDTDTLFQAASISKPITALAALNLVEEGYLELDDDINLYLRTWKLPDSNFSKNEKVTLRRLLTHTSGLNVNGFPGYNQNETIPDINSVLNGLGNTLPIRLKSIPGVNFEYSGGGYTVIEKVIEDITNSPLEEYMEVSILNPIGMSNSTFEQPLPKELHYKASAAYDMKGKIISGLWNNYPEQAAAGLWTTPTDLANYCIEIQEILNDKPNGILSRDMTEQMLTVHKSNWGMGMQIEGVGEKLGFTHGGKNAGFTNDLVSYPYRRDAVIVMTNGDNAWGLIEKIKRAVSKNIWR